MSKVTELATELANAIKEDSTLVEYYAASTAYNTSAELQGALQDYAAQRAILGAEYGKNPEEQNQEFMELVRKKMDELAASISSSEEYLNLTAAQTKVNDMMENVNNIIQKIVFNVDPDASCTHDCSTCHSSCASRT